MKWSSHNFKWKPSSWIHWWLLNVVADCKAISNADPLLKSSQRGTEWPTAKIWLYKWVFFLFLNGPFMLLSCSFSGKYMKSSFRENTASLSQASVQYSLKSIIWKHVRVVTLPLSGICERLYVSLKEHYIYNMPPFVLREKEWYKSRPPSPQMV